MQVTPQMFLIVLPMVFLAATVDAIAGGGGLISLPAYTLAGLNYDFASGDNTKYSYDKYMQIFDKEIRPVMEKALK